MLSPGALFLTATHPGTVAGPYRSALFSRNLKLPLASALQKGKGGTSAGICSRAKARSWPRPGGQVATARDASTTPDVPLSSVGVDGGDVWSGQRVSKEELLDRVEEACGRRVTSPIIAQYYPSRGWLWQQWGGTVVRRTLPREVAWSMLFATAFSLIFCAPCLAPWAALAETKIAGVAKAWTLSMTMASLVLSFFLSQSYALWRSVYSVCRRVQGRLNDLGLMCATFAERDSETGMFTVSTPRSTQPHPCPKCSALS